MFCPFCYPLESRAIDRVGVAKGQASLPSHERSEWPDLGENPRILNYFEIGAAGYNNEGTDELDWCAAFINYCLETAGYSGTGHPGARSFFWNKHQHFIKLEEPVYGCVAVFRNRNFDEPEWETGLGHVGFVTSWTDTTLTLLGGNQDKTVRTRTYNKISRNNNGEITRKLVAYMMPVMN